MKNLLIGAVMGALLVAGVLSVRNSQSPTTASTSPQIAGTNALSKMVVHKSPTCGCCNNYISYLRREGYDVEVMNHENMDPIKDQYNIPSGMQSCHTTIIGDYVSEGHVPSESIAKMMNEKPKIAGITMPGMPAGAPGMGGAKNKPFAIYGFTTEGEITTFDQQ
jgi:hypothetical protein